MPKSEEQLAKEVEIIDMMMEKGGFGKLESEELRKVIGVLSGYGINTKQFFSATEGGFVNPPAILKTPRPPIVPISPLQGGQ